MKPALRFILASTLFLSSERATAAPAEILPLEKIRPGMTGEGRTVFSGEHVDTFKVTILGVLRNYGPKQNLILARLEGGPLGETGVIAGMSGSPVYIDGKLAGAVSYSFPFSKEPFAGITPIEEIIEATASGPGRRKMASLSFPLTPERVESLPPARLPPVAILGSSLSGSAELSHYLGRLLSPILTPVSLHGFSPESFDPVVPLLRKLGLEPVLGGAAGSAFQSAQIESDRRAANRPPLEPGEAFGVGLISGDLDITAVGTVTHVDPSTGNVYGFGHPLFNLGPIEYPMTRATVHLVIPSLYTSFKLASSGEVVGTWIQDRTSGIRGVLRTRPKMIPLSVEVRTSRGQEKSYQLQLVNDELFSPLLTYVSLISILHTTEREFGTQTVKVSAWISLEGERRVNIEDVFADRGPALAASAMVAAPLSFLMSNDFKPVAVEQLRVSIEASESPQTAKLVRAWLDRDQVAPGSTVSLKLLLRSYRGEDSLKTVTVEIPPNAGEGKLQLLVADAATISSLEQREIRQSFVPRDLDQLIRSINSLRKNNRLYLKLWRGDRGVIVRGEYLSSLPPSVLEILEADRSSASYIPIQKSTVWEYELVTDYSLTGARVLEIDMKNP